MNINHEFIKFMNYNKKYDENKFSDEQFMTEEEYKNRLILGFFTKDGLILIISYIIFFLLLGAVYFYFSSK